jgi:pSer/pThr/pTyr-binding forkhead associated (FHA) protein
MTVQNRTYIIGRKGNIQLFDKTASARHAELVILNDKLYLTDLNSKNGTYLMDDGKQIPFKEGYIQLNQTLMFGAQVCSVRELMARAQLVTNI